MSESIEETGGWYWTGPNEKRWGPPAPERSEGEKRAELSALVETLPAEWLDAIIRAAKNGPEVLDSAFEPDFPRDPAEDDVHEVEHQVWNWAADAIYKVKAPDYALNLPGFALPKWGFGPEVSLAELAEAGGFDADSFTAQVAEDARWFDAQTITEANGEQWNPHTKDRGGEYAGTLERALTQMLRNRGILRGPCPRCNRPEWLTKYRPPKSPGRTPLDHTYCPDCVTAIKREQKADSMRRARAAEKP